jgi:hypothetical protein
MEGLPKEPEPAFTAQVEILWIRVQSDIEANQYVTPYKIGFVSDVLAAAEVFGIDALKEWTLPDPDDDIGPYFERFSMAVNHFPTKARLRLRATSRLYSVALDAVTKRKVHHVIEQILQTIEDAGLSVEKHDSLMSKLNDFEREIDRTRTAFQQFAAITHGRDIID